MGIACQAEDLPVNSRVFERTCAARRRGRDEGPHGCCAKRGHNVNGRHQAAVFDFERKSINSAPTNQWISMSSHVEEKKMVDGIRASRVGFP